MAAVNTAADASHHHSGHIVSRKYTTSAPATAISEAERRRLRVIAQPVAVRFRRQAIAVLEEETAVVP